MKYYLDDIYGICRQDSDGTKEYWDEDWKDWYKFYVTIDWLEVTYEDVLLELI